MPSIRKRGAKWNVQVRHRGQLNLSKTFTLKADAIKWAHATEAALDRGDVLAHPLSPKVTFGDILERFRSEVVPRKKSSPVERYIIGGVLKNEIAAIDLKGLKSHHFARYRDERLQQVTGSTVARELSVIHQALEVAMNASKLYARVTMDGKLSDYDTVKGTVLNVVAEVRLGMRGGHQ